MDCVGITSYEDILAKMLAMDVTLGFTTIVSLWSHDDKAGGQAVFKVAGKEVDNGITTAACLGIPPCRQAVNPLL